MNKRKMLLILSLALGTFSILGILVPVATQTEATGFCFYKLSFIAAIATIITTLVIVLISRRLVDTILFLTMILFGGYIILYVIIAHRERERATQLLECAIRLSYIQSEIVHYCERTRKYPIRLTDLDLLDKDLAKCPESGHEYLLWPNGIPDGPLPSPIPRLLILASEPEPRHTSPWFLPMFPYPTFLDHENEWFCNSRPEIAHRLIENRKYIERERHSFFAMRCTGSLYVTGEGAIRIPGGGYTNISGLKLGNENPHR